MSEGEDDLPKRVIQVNARPQDMPELFLKMKARLKEVGDFEGARELTTFKIAESLDSATACYMGDGRVVMLQECAPDDARLIACGSLLKLLRKNLVRFKSYIASNPDVKVKEVPIDGVGPKDELDFGNF